ncbi:MAG: FkbM family methyltransferase [Chthoniobacterales bacterium]
MGATNEFLKRVLPPGLQRAIFRFLWNPVRDAYWRRLRLGCNLPSGLHVEIRNRSDWEIYNEVLVNGEYDVPIDFALAGREQGQPFLVVDLGGNVGYFTFRCADRFFRHSQEHSALRIVLIEGSPTVCAEVERRIAAEPLLRKSVAVRHGLVGKKTGEAYIGGSHIHYGNVISADASPGAMRVPFIDLDREFADVAQIDLLKCDIEGAEFDFIDNFQPFLRKVRAAALEFHRYGKSIGDARETLRACGFRNRRVLRETETFSVEFYWR